jgi:two-component SAPR family response regulator
MTDSLRIIVVDDETIIAEYLSTFLKKQGHEVKPLYSADGAFVELLNKFEPDLVFLDINLNSTLTGIDLAKVCNEKGIPFIYLTSYSDQKTIESALTFDPVSYILKPFTEKDIQVNLEIAKVKIRKSQASTNTNGILVLREGYDTIELRYLKSDGLKQIMSIPK